MTQTLQAKNGKVLIQNPYYDLFEFVEVSQGIYTIKWKQAL